MLGNIESPFHAYFEFKRRTFHADFDNYFEAVERCCVRFEDVGEKKERFAYARVERGGVKVWEIAGKTPSLSASSIGCLKCSPMLEFSRNNRQRIFCIRGWFFKSKNQT